jgi:7-carboxy-7-deazaguanine synthase
VLKLSQNNNLPEIFYSVQGEGPNLGYPAVFLRLAQCNLKCRWCDTRYTWDNPPSGPQTHSIEMSGAAIEKEILKYGRRYLVVTGGEPLLQQEGLIPLLESLKKQGFFLEIETNGTLLPDPRLFKIVDHWNVSPKLNSSGNSVKAREIPACYRAFSSAPACHFKFVIQDNEDFSELLGLVNQYRLSANRIILMPEGRNTTEIIERSRWLVELCKESGFRLSTRLQTILWGDERGK